MNQNLGLTSILMHFFKKRVFIVVIIAIWMLQNLFYHYFVELMVFRHEMHLITCFQVRFGPEKLTQAKMLIIVKYQSFNLAVSIFLMSYHFQTKT